MMSIGITTKALRMIRESRVLKLLGGFKYFFAATWQTIRSLNSFERIMVSSNAQEWTPFEDMYMCAIGRSKYFGGGQRICPNAEIGGDQLDACILNDMNCCKLFLRFPFELKHGLHSTYSKMLKVSKLDIRAMDEEMVEVELDGEIVGCLPAAIDCSNDVSISIAHYSSQTPLPVIAGRDAKGTLQYD
jgi:diacylglycerol kinase family enzyme